MKAPASVHWGVNGWTNVADLATRDTGLGVHVVDLPTRELVAGDSIEFTWRWLATGAWEGQDHEVLVAG